MRLPEFIVFGQIRAGTTTLYEYFRQHPDIFVPEIKELRYFNFANGDPRRSKLTPRGLPLTLEQYCAHFAGAPLASVAGDISPQYIDSSVAAMQIRSVIPKVKLIASLRNPVDRIYSQYLLSVQAGDIRGEFRDWFDRRKSDGWEVRAASAVEGLQRFYGAFPREQIKTILFDDLIRDQQSVMRGLFEYLGVDPNFRIERPILSNASGIPRSTFLARFRNKVVTNRALTKGIRATLPTFLIQALKRVDEINLRKPDPLDPEFRRFLVDWFYDDIKRLEEMLDRDLSDWIRTP